MKRLTLILSLTMLATFAPPIMAQGRGGQGREQESNRGDSIPARYRPPPGMCRIWITGVPANQQPAATDCASAIRNRPRNGRVIFGPELPRSKTVPDPKGEPSRKGEPPLPIPRRGSPPG